MILECKNCQLLITDDDLDTTTVDLDDYYGVGGDFNTRTYANVDCCPHCGSIELSELTEREIVESYNYLWRKVK